MRSFYVLACLGAAASPPAASAFAFAPGASTVTRSRMTSAAAAAAAAAAASSSSSSSSSLSMSAGPEAYGTTRRQLLAGVSSAALGAVFLAASPEPAAAADWKKVNTRLAGYGLPQIAQPPEGMTTVLEVYGRDEARETLLVGWNFPKGWVVQRTNIDVNSEAGTVATGDYQKGDSASLYVGPKSLLGGKSLSTDKELVRGLLTTALGVKGENQFQNLKIKSISEGPEGLKGQKYIIASFTYELLTGAGFNVDRVGRISITQAGNGVQAVVAATTSKRAKKLNDELDEIARSFRVYTGILMGKGGEPDAE